jgi:uncharacterized membrane protein
MANRVATGARWALATLLAIAGVAHFVALDSFLLLVPSWLPWPSAIVWVSGAAEIAFAAALLGTPEGERRRAVGWGLVVFFVVVFLGNLSQALSGVDAFGLDTDAERWVRLTLQPVLIVWAMWVTGIWLSPRPPR